MKAKLEDARLEADVFESTFLCPYCFMVIVKRFDLALLVSSSTHPASVWQSLGLQILSDEILFKNDLQTSNAYLSCRATFTSVSLITNILITLSSQSE